jgi:hypothetical protein
MLRLSLAVLISILSVGCTSDNHRAPLSIERLGSPAQGYAGQVSVASLPGGGHIASWIERDDDIARLMVATLKGDEWSEPAEAARGSNWFINWADFPSVLAVDDSTWYTFILPQAGQGTYAYHVHSLVTTDAGLNWSEPRRLHDDDSPTEHGFVSMTAHGSQALAIWLDGRQGATASESPGHGHAPMSLRAGFISPDGATVDAFEIDERVCDCCQTSAVNVAASTLVAYRNRAADETRDIHLARFDGTGWSAIGVLHDDGWVIAGCPVNGPALAADGAAVAAAWFTAAGNKPRVYVARSRDEGATFDSPIRVDGGQPLGRVDVVMSGGDILVSWIEETETGAELRLAQVGPTGDISPHVAAPMTRSRGGGFPRMAVSGGNVLLAWLDYDEDSRQTRIEVARVRLN